jgi:hypothetical protein
MLLLLVVVEVQTDLVWLHWLLLCCDDAGRTRVLIPPCLPMQPQAALKRHTLTRLAVTQPP